MVIGTDYIGRCDSNKLNINSFDEKWIVLPVYRLGSVPVEYA